MRYLPGVERDEETYVTISKYRELTGTAATEPGGEDAIVLAYARRATQLFDRLTRRTEGYWLKSRPMELMLNGSGHTMLHSPAPFLAVRTITSREEGILATASSVAVPLANQDQDGVGILFYGRSLGDQLDAYQVAITTDSESGRFSVALQDPDGRTIESFPDLSTSFEDSRYVRRVINAQSDYIVVELYSREPLKAGTYTLSGGSDAIGIRAAMKFFSRTDGGDFSDEINDITIQGEIGEAFEPPQAVISAVAEMIELMRLDKFKVQQERRYYETPGRIISFESITGSQWLDLVIEQYRRTTYDTILDIH